MDPNETLRRIRAVRKRITNDVDEGNPVKSHDGEELAELVEALDQWITNGGFLPDAWTRLQRRQVPPC